MDRVHGRHVCTFSRFLLISDTLAYGYPELCIATILSNAFRVSLINNKKTQYSCTKYELIEMTKNFANTPKNAVLGRKPAFICRFFSQSGGISPEPLFRQRDKRCRKDYPTNIHGRDVAANVHSLTFPWPPVPCRFACHPDRPPQRSSPRRQCARRWQAFGPKPTSTARPPCCSGRGLR